MTALSVPCHMSGLLPEVTTGTLWLVNAADEDALLQVPPEVTVHTSSPAVDLLYALYFYLT